MKFRTEIPLNEHHSKLNYHDEVLFLGSCFSVHIHNKMKGLKFNSMSNSFGIVYNPLSLSSQLLRTVENKSFTEKDLHFNNERWFSFNHHSDFSFSDKTECLNAINLRLNQGHQQLKSAKFLFITLGSSWVYYRNEDNEIVSNCHKIPAKEFTKFLADPADMVEQLSYAISELKKINPTISTVFSVSPVRHLADGFFENQVSKGRLFDVIHQLKAQDNTISYFPSYEFLMDDLRDYRFYKSDLLHPSNEAVQYIWERFVATYFSSTTIETMGKVEKILQATNHRPFNPNSAAHQKFIVKTISSMENLKTAIFGGFEEEMKKLK